MVLLVYGPGEGASASARVLLDLLGGGPAEVLTCASVRLSPEAAAAAERILLCGLEGEERERVSGLRRGLGRPVFHVTDTETQSHIFP